MLLELKTANACAVSAAMLVTGCLLVGDNLVCNRSNFRYLRSPASAGG